MIGFMVSVISRDNYYPGSEIDNIAWSWISYYWTSRNVIQAKVGV